jgi:hypothetical protein
MSATNLVAGCYSRGLICMQRALARAASLLVCSTHGTRSNPVGLGGGERTTSIFWQFPRPLSWRQYLVAHCQQGLLIVCIFMVAWLTLRT